MIHGDWQGWQWSQLRNAHGNGVIFGQELYHPRSICSRECPPYSNPQDGAEQNKHLFFVNMFVFNLCITIIDLIFLGVRYSL